MSIRVIIPAAGKGTRLCTSENDPPKVMRICAGKPLLETVLENTSFVSPEDTYIVVGYRKEDVMNYFGEKYHFIEQKEQLGTGHAVAVCANEFKDYDGEVLVTFGDMPLFRSEDMLAMCEQNHKNHAACTLMTAENSDLKMWARVIKDDKGTFLRIVEGKDCNEEQKKIKELFSGVIVFDSKALFSVLPEVSTNNVQHEYYLTEVPELMVKKGMRVDTYHINDGNDLRGVNTPDDLVVCEKILSARKK